MEDYWSEFDFLPGKDVVQEAGPVYSRNPHRNSNVVLRKSFELALGIMGFADELNAQKRYTFSKQILRSGTSISANLREAKNAESRKDFIHKVKIAAKEVDELEYWLQLCYHYNGYPSPQESLLLLLDEVSKITNKIISSARKNQ
jgi:four helix bundle protein